MDEYYYGQGKVYLAPYKTNAYVQWRWIGDVSSLKLNFEFEEKYSKRSIGGRLINDKRFITFIGGNISAKWYERSLENLALLLNSQQTTNKQSWQQEIVNNIQIGMTIPLMHQNIRNITIENLTNDIDYIVNYEFGSILFLTTPIKQPFMIEYDYSGCTGVGILNQQTTELMLRYEGVNLAKNNEKVFIELYRLSLDPVDAINLIDSESDFSNVETVLQLLPDLTKSPKSDFGLFGRMVNLSEFKLITYNGEINHDGSHNYAY
ncbi:hypothetical protein PT276_01515 [Orbaceae bacterium ESL0721]|nr:hypothetical protein [Orbaceae bacterium ESL0721]